MLNFTIPDSGDLTPLNLGFLRLIKYHPEYFYDDFKIKSAYGCPPGCIWNGGRENLGTVLTDEEILKKFKDYKETETEYWLTFTNRLLRPEHLSDSFGKNILKIAEESGEICRIIVASDVMEDFIKQNYPHLKVVQSICRFEYDIDKLNQMSENDITVLPLSFNNDFEKLSKLKHPENIEMIINEECIENCPNTIKHFDWISKFVLKETEDFYPRCKFICTGDYKSRKHYIPRSLFSKYEEMGFSHFKLSGRYKGLNMAPIYIENFVRPRYEGIVISELERILMLNRNDGRRGGEQYRGNFRN